MGNGIYPYSGSEHAGKYWKYQNKDPSTAYYGAKVAVEIISEIQDKIRKRGTQIYGTRPGAIMVQELVHEATRQLAKMLNEDVKEIEKLEKENSGTISHYFDTENGEDEGDKDPEGKGEDDQDLL